MPSTGSTIGFVGLGSMGRPMAARLAGAGYALAVYDAKPGRAQAFVAEYGGTAPATLAEVGAVSDLAITMLPTGAIVRTVVAGDPAGAGEGADCLLAGMRKDTLLVDMSSSEPAGTRQLGATVAGKGVHMLDAPVSGGVGKAVTGELAVLVGGDEALLERWRPVLSTMGTSFVHTGPLGAGHAIKALNNLLSAAGLIAAIEVMLIGARFGLTPSVMLTAINASTGRNNSTERKFEPFILSGGYDSGFSLDLMVKDLGIALNIAHDTGTPSPVSEGVLARFIEAQEFLGPGADHTAVAKFLQDLVGTRLDDGS